jgi:hypothetical protein
MVLAGKIIRNEERTIFHFSFVITMTDWVADAVTMTTRINDK